MTHTQPMSKTESTEGIGKRGTKIEKESEKDTEDP